ncbi:MAG: DNA polymerase IV [Deltaproteobacteria bacterium]|nr:DNA polymerase IV [Deltaproteobacteria bacterium]
MARPPPERTIFHVDMDAFYAAVEQRDQPELRGKPVIVGGPVRRGVVSTASYEAREFGVHSAMPMAQALRACPQAVVLPVRMEQYVAVSRVIMDVFSRFSPLVEPLSLDEAFLDMTGTDQLFGPPLETALAVREAVREATELSCAVGVASNKFLAKLASDLDKPGGVTVVPRGREREFIAPLTVSRLWGAGPKTVEKLARMGLRTVGEVATADPWRLRKRLGSHGEHLQCLARGLDDRPVHPPLERKSVGSERTLQDDVSGRTNILRELALNCDRVARQLRAKGLKAWGVRVKVRYTTGFRLSTRDGRLPVPCDDSEGLLAGARSLLDRLDLDRPMRLVGLAAFDLVAGASAVQGDLFHLATSDRRSRLEHALDDLRARHGDKVTRAGRKGPGVVKGKSPPEERSGDR